MIILKGDWIEFEIDCEPCWGLVVKVYPSVSTFCGYYLQSGDVITRDFRHHDGKWRFLRADDEGNILNLPGIVKMKERLRRGPVNFLPIDEREDANDPQSRVSRIRKK